MLPSDTIKGVNNRTDYLKRLAAADNEFAAPNELLLTWGFHHYFHGKLTKVDLDIINAKRPIIVWYRSAHKIILNSIALELHGLNEDFVKAQTASTQKQINIS